MKTNLYISISTCFGLGYISALPGTLTSFITLVIIWTIQVNLGIQITLLFVFFVSLIGYIAIEKNPDKTKDPKEIVIDEVIGQSFVLIFLPVTYQNYLLAFIFFRIFDIFKPYPIDYFENKYRNAFGVIFDDLIAAGYALLIIFIINNII